MRSLPLFHRIAGQPIIVVGDGAAAAAKRRLVERAGGRSVGTDNRAARLAFIATDAPEAVAAELRGRGVLVNVADRPDLCDFTLPSVLERGPVTVAISTDGASAGLAKALRLRLEALLPESLGRLAETLAAAREQIRQRWPDPADRRHALDVALGEGGPLDPLKDDGHDGVAVWLAGEELGDSLSLTIVLTSDDPDDLTLRQARALGRADIVRHDPAVAGAILVRARADAERRLLDDPRPDAGTVVTLRRG